jgi:hypothetical protein
MGDTEAPDSPLLAELKWVHSMVRQDLQTCTDLANAVADGAPASCLQTELASLQTSRPLFQLRVSCLRYCAFVHSHHAAEDVALFPAVRRAAPGMAAVVDRLEADHRAVSDLLDAVQAAGEELADPNHHPARERLVGALNGLTEPLLEHLAFEEESLAPVFDGWDRWPFFA